MNKISHFSQVSLHLLHLATSVHLLEVFLMYAGIHTRLVAGLQATRGCLFEFSYGVIKGFSCQSAHSGLLLVASGAIQSTVGNILPRGITICQSWSFSVGNVPEPTILDARDSLAIRLRKRNSHPRVDLHSRVSIIFNHPRSFIFCSGFMLQLSWLSFHIWGQSSSCLRILVRIV